LQQRSTSVNSVNSRSGDLMALLQKMTEYVPRAGTASDPLCVIASAGVARYGFNR
jgi:hypothetical protein